MMEDRLIKNIKRIEVKNKFHQLFYLCPLDLETAKTNSQFLISLINTIPYINWTENDLLNNSNESKWNISILIRNSNDEIVGLLLSYIRTSDSKHIFDSIYIHKFVIAPTNQRQGLGSNVLKTYIGLIYSKIPWALNITVQTNDENCNCGVISFYKKLNFANQYVLNYKEKKDIVFLYSRENFESDYAINQLFIDEKYIFLPHPRLKNDVVLNETPTLFFSTTNKTKQGLHKFIFNNYNFNLVLFPQKYKLFEPQVEKASIAEERNLVESPLKSVSRFLEKTGKTPFYVEDTMLFLEFFNKDFDNPDLPGHDTKRWWRQLGDSGIIDILGNSEKRKARFVSQIGAYIGKGKYIYGRGVIDGSISFEPRISEISNKDIPKTYPFYFHSIFIPNGSDKTLAEMDVFEFSKNDYVRKCIINFIENWSKESIFHNDINLFNYLKNV